MFGIFFYVTLFVQRTLGYSPLKAGVAFLPISASIIFAAQISSRFQARTGPKPFMAGGAVLVTTGLLWLTRTTAHSGYPEGVLGPTMVFGFGMGCIFVPLMLIAVAGVSSRETGAASGLLNATQQIGGSLGLSILTTVFGTAARDEAKTQIPSFLAQATPAQKAEFAKTRQLPGEWADHVLAHGISQAFAVGAALSVVALLTAVFVIQAKASDLPATPAPGAA
jgi:MFS family permease